MTNAKKLLELENTIDNLLLPFIPKFIKAVDNKDIPAPLRIFLSNIGHVNVYKSSEIGIIIKSLLQKVKQDINSLESYLGKFKKDISTTELVNASISNLNGFIFFTTELMAVMFVDYDELPRGKKESLLENMELFTKIALTVGNGDIISSIKESPAGVPIQQMHNNGELPFIRTFNGNPFFWFGKKLADSRAKKIKIIEDRIKYMELEILDMEVHDDDKRYKKSIDFYRKRIEDEEMEIDEIRKKYE